MKQTQTKQNRAGALLELAIALVVQILLYYISRAIWVTLPILAIPGVYIGARRGFGWGLALAVLSSAAAYLLLGQPGLFLIIMALPIFLLGWVAVRFLKRAYDGLILICGAMVLSVIAAIFAVQLLLGKDLVSYIVDYLAWLFVQNDQIATLFYCLFHAGEISTGVLSVEAFLAIPMEEIVAYVTSCEQLNALRSLLSDFLPVLSVSYCVYGGVLTYFIPRALSKKTGGQVAGVPAFSDFFLPKDQGIYMLLLAVLSLLPSLFGWERYLLMGDMLFTLATAVFAIEGMSFADFLLRIKIKSPYARGAILALLYLFVPYLLMTAGAVEQGMQLRRRIRILKS